MKRKELKNLAEKIAKAELICSSPLSTTKEKNAACQEIDKLASHVDSFEDMMIIDELVQDILAKEKKF